MFARWLHGIFLFTAICAFAASTSAATQTDVALSVYGAFSGATTGNATSQSPANAAGGMIELRHISSPLAGFEATYSFNRANQTYTALASPAFGPASAAISANAHEIAGDWVISMKARNLRPFGLAGIGVLLNVPTDGTYYPCPPTPGSPCPGLVEKAPTST